MICLQDVLQTSSRHVFKTSSRHVFKTSSIRLQRNIFSSSKMSSRRLQVVLEDEKLLRWRRIEDDLKTSWRPKNVCWEYTSKFPNHLMIWLQNLFIFFTTSLSLKNDFEISTLLKKSKEQFFRTTYFQWNLYFLIQILSNRNTCLFCL